MSLINQMLKDLDKRHATEGEDQPLSGDVRATPSRKKKPVFALVLMAVVLVGMAVLMWQKNHRSGAQSHSPALQIPAAMAPPAVNPVAIESPPATAWPAAKPGTAATPPGSTSAPAAKLPPHGTMEAKIQTEPKRAKTAKADGEKKAIKAEEAAVIETPGVLKNVRLLAKPHDSLASSFKVVNPVQRSENLYRQAVTLLQQDRGPEALVILRQAIEINSANHGARQLLAGILADAKRSTEAVALLKDGLALAPGDSAFAMELARLQVAANAKTEAISTLEQGLVNAGDDAEYHAFYAALLQSQGRNAEATRNYITALRSDPSMPTWLIGVGISLQAENKLEDAAEAFQRAIDTGELSPALAQFASQRLKQIRRQH